GEGGRGANGYRSSYRCVGASVRERRDERPRQREGSGRGAHQGSEDRQGRYRPHRRAGDVQRRGGGGRGGGPRGAGAERGDDPRSPGDGAPRSLLLSAHGGPETLTGRP